MATSEKTCEICKSSDRRYTCPRCNVSYCSTSCYQSETHSECSESFFKDCVDEMLRSTGGDPHEKRAAEELLTKIGGATELDEQLLDSDDDDDFATLDERLRDVDLDDSESVWSRLTDEEKRGYFEFLRSGDLTAVDPWEPFWTKKFRGKVVDVRELERLKEGCPAILKIKDFKTICSKPPSHCVQCNLINVLAAYAFTTRYFGGEHSKEPKEAVACICSISRVLKSNDKFESFDQAVQSVIYEYKNLTWIETSEENERLLISDLEAIFEGPHVTESKLYVLCCLSDLSRLFKLALKGDASKEKMGRFRSSEIQLESAEKVKLHVKKFGYYLSYVKDVLSNEFCGSFSHNKPINLSPFSNL